MKMNDSHMTRGVQRSTPGTCLRALKRAVSALLCLFFLVFTVACSVMLGGRSQVISVATEPAGARITINGMMVGVSPMQTTIPRKETAAIMASKTGYTPVMRMTERHISPYGIADGIGGFFTFGFMWFGLITPGAWQQEPANIMMALPPSDEPEKK